MKTASQDRWRPLVMMDETSEIVIFETLLFIGAIKQKQVANTHLRWQTLFAEQIKSVVFYFLDYLTGWPWTRILGPVAGGSWPQSVTSKRFRHGKSIINK